MVQEYYRGRKKSSHRKRFQAFAVGNIDGGKLVLAATICGKHFIFRYENPRIIG
jgi:hypothetical protein